MSRRAFVLSCLILLILFGFAWLARNTLQGRTAESTEGERAFAQAVLRSLESPALAPWLNKVTTLLRDHPRLVRYVVARPGAKPAADVAEIAAGHILTFPHFANGAAGGVSIRASVILINNAGATATGKIFLWRNNGQSMSVGTNLGTGSTFNFTLRAGETLRLDTDGLGDLVVGWVEAQSDVEISGTAKFTTLDSAGRFLSEVGIGDSVRAKKLMILIDTTSGKDSGFAVCNPNAAGAASLSLNLRKMDGTSVGTVSSNLKPLNQTAQFVTQTFAGDAAKNFKGLLVISSDTPLISVVTLRTQGLNYTSLPAVPEAPSGDAEDLLFARTGDGVFGNLRLQTSFFLMNNSAGPVSATLKSYAAAGGGLPLKIGGSRKDEFAVTVPAGGAVALESDGSTNPGAVGWARVTSETPLAGGAAFTLTTIPTGAFQAEVGVPASPLTPMPAIYVQEQGDSSTALALTNPVDEPVTVRLRLTGRAGTSPEIQAEKQLELAPLSHVALYVPQFFPDVPAVGGRDFSGRLETEAWLTEMGEDFPSEVAGLTLLSHGTYLTSAPVAQFIVNFGPRTSICPATVLEGTAPAFRMKLTQLAGEVPMRTGIVTLNKGSLDLSRFQKAKSVGQLKAGISVFLLMGECFVFEKDAASAQFYSPLTADGVADWEPFFVKASNLAGGGVKFEVTGESHGEPEVGMSFAGLFDLLPELVRLPSGSGTTITITEDYESDLLPSGISLKSARVRTFTTGGLPSGAPRIYSVTPSTVVGGQQVTIDGAGFSSSPAGNAVTVEGDSRVAAPVVEATPTRLVVQLPESLKTGSLRVTSGGKDSNDYALHVLFAPVLKLSVGSRIQAAATTLRMEIGQHFGEIGFHELISTPSGGEWITSGTGLAAGAIIGTAGLESPEDYDLKVKSSDADKLVVDVIEKGKTSTEFQITLCKSCTDAFKFAPVQTSLSYVMPQEGSFVINFTTPIYRNPSGAGKLVTFNTKIFSLPERTMIRTTRLAGERQLSFTTQ